MSTILVTGASGFVGSHVLPALLERGHRAVALVRSRASGDRVLARLGPAATGVEVRLGDVTDPATVPAALAGTDAVVHLVAIPRDRDGGASLRLVNTEGTRNLAVAMEGSSVRRLVHLGALGVADDPRLHYASSKAKAEAIVASSALEWTILEPSLMWGERDGFFNIMAGLVRMSPGLVPVPGDERDQRHRHRHDDPMGAHRPDDLPRDLAVRPHARPAQLAGGRDRPGALEAERDDHRKIADRQRLEAG
ncbi:MAG TPA: NAD(P)H-binding protein, partial [Candidatus Dormibacteraeota bacterium]|nr:NAD(P)H-binding protein [Candidatus Dormibacteraeota bacterium]